MKAKSMVLEKFRQPLNLREIEIPKLEEGQILVKILAAGVCGSDVHMWNGNDSRTILPLILGHEGVGEIVEMTTAKASVYGQSLKVGDQIVWNRGISCGQCYFCQVLHEPSLCPRRWVYGIHRSSSQFPYLLGCFSEYIILEDGADVFPLPGGIEPAVVVPATCSGATTAHAFDLGCPSPGDSIVIMGPGPLGIFGVAFAKARGAGEIIVIGGTAERLELCREFGATCLMSRIDSEAEERLEIIREMTNGRGVDLVYEAAGNPGAVREGLNVLRTGGTLLSAGFGDPNGTVELDCFADICRKNIRLQGVWVSDTRHTHQALELVKANSQLFSKLVTHRFPLDEADMALAAMANKDAVKAVLIPENIGV